MPALPSVRTTLEGLARDFEPATLSGPQAVRMVKELGTIRCLTDGLLAKAARRVDETAAYARGNDRDAAALAAKAMGTSPSEARSLMNTAAKLEQFAATDAAVRAGKLSAREAQLIADTAKVNPDAEQDLIAAAAGGLAPLSEACLKARAAVETGTDRSRRQHRSRSLRMWTDADGMVGGRFSLTPEIGGQIKTIIDGLAGKIFRKRRSGSDHEPMEAYAADALAEAVLGDSAGSVDGGDEHATPAATPAPVRAATPAPAPKPKAAVKFTVHILIDHATLVRGEVGEGEVCEIAGVGPVDVGWVRDLLGDAFLTAVIRHGKDVKTVAHLGRHVPAELRTALIAAGRECDVDGCHHRGYLELDHSEIDYAKGGPTAWWNLTWLCYLHHKRKTAGATLGPPDPMTRKRSMTEHDDQTKGLAA